MRPFEVNHDGDTGGAVLRRGWAWLMGVPPSDPMAQRHAPSVLVLCGLGSIALIVGELLRWQAGLVTRDLPVSLMRTAGAAILIAALFLIRRGRFQDGVSLFVTGAVALSAGGVALTGFSANARNLTELTMPLALAALLIGRRALWTAMAAYAVGFLVGDLRDKGHLWGHGPQAPPALPFGAVGTAIMGFAVVAIVLDRVGFSLREGFDLALARQRKLEQASADLESANVALKAEMARRQNAEAQLIEAQKMEAISRLSGGVAHDFNNLLTVILGSSEIAKQSLNEQDPVQEYLNEVTEAATRAADLTRQLLAFARRQLVEPKVLSVDERVRSTQKMLVRLLREDIRLSTELSAENWKVLIDPGQLDQVLVNFAVNARDAMPLGGPLTIRTREVSISEDLSSALFSLRAGDYVVLEIADRGTGMDSETSRRVFEPFFTTKSETTGTGLGLATCYGIVMQAGGAIFFDTEVGSGTTFRIYLPRSEMPKSDAAQTPAVEAAQPTRGETLLVVEDEPSLRQVMIRALVGAGYRVFDAGGVEQAVSSARAIAGPIDLLISDLVLPDGSGGDVAAQITQLRPDIRVLYVSGHTDDPALRRGITENELNFLAKPFAPARLVTRVREVLQLPARRLQ